VAHTCNPSYSGGSQFEANLGKQFVRPYLEKKTSQESDHKKRKKIEHLKYGVVF
jgi:hypothetical protein